MWAMRVQALAHGSGVCTAVASTRAALRNGMYGAAPKFSTSARVSWLD